MLCCCSFWVLVEPKTLFFQEDWFVYTFRLDPVWLVIKLRLLWCKVNQLHKPEKPKLRQELDG